MYSKSRVHKLILHFEKPVEELSTEELEKLWKEVECFKKECKGKFSARNLAYFGRKRIELICAEEPELVKVD